MPRTSVSIEKILTEELLEEIANKMNGETTAQFAATSKTMRSMIRKKLHPKSQAKISNAKHSLAQKRLDSALKRLEIATRRHSNAWKALTDFNDETINRYIQQNMNVINSHNGRGYKTPKKVFKGDTARKRILEFTDYVFRFGGSLAGSSYFMNEALGTSISTPITGAWLTATFGLYLASIPPYMADAFQRFEFHKKTRKIDIARVELRKAKNEYKRLLLKEQNSALEKVKARAYLDGWMDVRAVALGVLHASEDGPPPQYAEVNGMPVNHKVSNITYAVSYRDGYRDRAVLQYRMVKNLRV